jgi:hypothetical protein
VNFAELGPDWDMLSRGLFISCLMDAVEHGKPQVQVRQAACNRGLLCYA